METSYRPIRPLGTFRVTGHDNPSLLRALQLQKNKVSILPKANKRITAIDTHQPM